MAEQETTKGAEDKTPAQLTQTIKSAKVEVDSKPTLLELLNSIKCNSILLNGIQLGDALIQLSAAISRSGTVLDDNGRIARKGVNNSLGELLREALGRVPRHTEVCKTVIGIDNPGQLVFSRDEANITPVNTEVILLLPVGKPIRFANVGENEAKPVALSAADRTG